MWPALFVVLLWVVIPALCTPRPSIAADAPVAEMPVVETTVSQLRAWSLAIERARDLDSLLEGMAAIAELWPVIVSADTAAEFESRESRRQAVFRRLSGVIVGHLERPIVARDSVSSGRRRHQLLDLRARFLDTPSYVNWLLADAVGRVLVAEIARDLVIGTGDVSSLRSWVEDLRAQTINIGRLAEIVVDEAGRDAESTLVLDGVTAHEVLTSLLGWLIGDPEETVSEEFFRGSFRELAESRNVIGWLFRIRQGDERIQLALPMVADMVGSIPIGGEEDVQVATIITALTGASGTSAIAPNAYGSSLSPWVGAAASEARNLIRRIRQGQRDALLYFGTPGATPLGSAAAENR